MLKSAPNPKGITTDISKKTGIYFWNDGVSYGSVDWTYPNNFDLYGADFISICNIGTVSGLGNITEIPVWGFTAPSRSNQSIACEAGCGYIIKMTNCNKLTVCARLYVVKHIVNKKRGIAGAVVKYQFPFVPI